MSSGVNRIISSTMKIRKTWLTFNVFNFSVFDAFVRVFIVCIDANVWAVSSHSCHHFNTQLKQAIRYRLIFGVSGKLFFLCHCVSATHNRNCRQLQSILMCLSQIDIILIISSYKALGFSYICYHHYLLFGVAVGLL